MTDWLAWIQRLRAIGQTGRAYSGDPYDLERFEEISTLAEAMLGGCHIACGPLLPGIDISLKILGRLLVHTAGILRRYRAATEYWVRGGSLQGEFGVAGWAGYNRRPSGCEKQR